MKVAIGTLGCKVNHFESEVIQENFEKNNFEVVNFNEKADIYIVNSCTVTRKSNYRSRQLIRKAINNNEDAFIVVTGCYVQLKEDEIAKIRGVDLILGNEEKFAITKYINRLEKLDRPRIIVGNINKKRDFASLYIKKFRGYTKAFIKIQTGCDFNCAYCSIWQARGPNRSEKPDLVVKQIEELIKSGYQEIVLTGVCLGNYGRDLGRDVNLANLLEKIEKIDELKRLRLSSIEPVEISDKLIDIMSHSSKICHHLHIPLQSGDDHILKLMNRKYNSKFYRRLINNLRKKMPDIGIGADVMVGFPDEIEERFQNTKRFIEELSITYLHVFSFSKREGTIAFNMQGQVPAEIKKQRSKILRDLGRMKSLEFKKSFLGKRLDILIENSRDKNTHLLKGFTENYIKIFLDGPDTLMRKIVPVRIREIKDGKVYGNI